jgi:hypothetical protein
VLEQRRGGVARAEEGQRRGARAAAGLGRRVGAARGRRWRRQSCSGGGLLRGRGGSRGRIKWGAPGADVKTSKIPGSLR